MFGLGGIEIIVIAVIVLLLCGPWLSKRMAKSLTETVRGLRQVGRELEEKNHNE